MRWPCGSPSGSAGVYLIENVRTGACYVGQAVCLASRYRHHAASGRRGRVTSGAMCRALQASDPLDWVFSVLAEMPGSTGHERGVVEAWFMRFALWCGRSLVNEKGATVREYFVRDGDRLLSVGEAASRLGIRAHALFARCRTRLGGADFGVVTMEDAATVRPGIHNGQGRPREACFAVRDGDRLVPILEVSRLSGLTPAGVRGRCRSLLGGAARGEVALSDVLSPPSKARGRRKARASSSGSALPGQLPLF